MPEASARRVLVIGGTGMVGSALLRELARRRISFEAPSRHELDASAAVIRIPGKGIGCVLNAALDRSGDTEQAWAVNARFPHLLAAECIERGIPLIHLSTDGVFSGRQGPYDETSAADTQDVYGRQKRDGEPASALVLRTSVIGPEEQGFASLLCRVLEAPSPIAGFTNHRWNGLTSLELARILAEISQRPELPVGIRHLHSDDTTKYALISMLCQAFGRKNAVLPQDAPTAIDRRLRTRHDHFMATLAVRPLSVQIDELPGVADNLGRWKSVGGEGRCRS